MGVILGIKRKGDYKMKKINSRKELANALNNGNAVDFSLISKRLARVVEMWLGYGDVKKVGNNLVGTFN